jgi:prepilin-type N-terminal cleavage/methylation domain-containing protein
MKKLNKKGFTLVELLLVIAIIGILAAVLFVSLGKQRERARLTTFKENMRGLVTAATACHDAGGGILVAAGTASGTATADGATPLCVPDNSIGNIPIMTECTGGTDEIDISIASNGSDIWELSATCVTSDETTDCVATCGMDGCVFTNCE